MVKDRKIRVLMAKPGLDGHDRGAKVVARALHEAGMQVFYTGIRQTPEMIAEAALHGKVDLIGLSILSGAHLELCPLIMEHLGARGLRSIPVLVGGIIPEEDVPALRDMGIRAIFGPGTRTGDVADFITRMVAED